MRLRKISKGMSSEEYLQCFARRQGMIACVVESLISRRLLLVALYMAMP